MKYIIEIYANGKAIGRLESKKEFKYEKSDLIIETYLNSIMPHRKSISSLNGSDDSYDVYFDDKSYTSICIYEKRRTYMDIKDSEGNPIVMENMYEGHEPGSDKIYHYSINGSGWNKDEYYIRNLSRYDRHYDWSSGSPKEIPAISDKRFKIDENTQELINQYELKPIKK